MVPLARSSNEYHGGPEEITEHWHGDSLDLKHKRQGKEFGVDALSSYCDVNE